MVRACDAKRGEEGGLCEWRRRKGRPKRRWLDRVRGDIKEKAMSMRKCPTDLHGVYHQTSTPT